MTEGLDSYVLVRVLLTLVITRGFRESDSRRDVFLVVKVGKRWQRTGRWNWSKGEDGVSRGWGAQTSVCFCSGFTGGWEVEFAIWQGFYAVCNTVIINGGRGAVTVGEPVGLSGGVNSNGIIDGGAVIVDGGAGTFLSGDREIGWGDRVRILQRWGDREAEGLRGKRRGGGDGGG